MTLPQLLGIELPIWSGQNNRGCREISAGALTRELAAGLCWNEGMQPDPDHAGLAWQTGVWDAMAQRYERDVDRRFGSVVEGVVQRAGLQPGEQVLDLGTGTGQGAIRAASLVGPAGHVTGVDISAEMLALARA